MSFEVEKTKVKVKVYGSEYDMCKPTVGQVEELQKFSNVEGASSTEQFKMIADFLEVLGLPKDVTNQMEIDHLEKLIKYLSGEMSFDKKKSEAGL